MAITTEIIIDTLKKVIEVLKIDDDEKIDLAIDILTLVINVIGAENITDAVEAGLENLMDYVSELISGESSDLTAEERAEKLAATRLELDNLFEKMAVLQG